MADPIHRHPLQWPPGRPRTPIRERSRFGCTFAVACDNVLREIRLLGGSDPVLSTDIPLRRDGTPRANWREPPDPGVAVYYWLKGRQFCFACDRWLSIRENLQAIAYTIAAVRGIERWGGGSMVEQAFTGFLALDAPKPAHEVLGVREGASADEVEAAYRKKAQKVHPDKGGTDRDMAELNAARDELLAAGDGTRS